MSWIHRDDPAETSATRRISRSALIGGFILCLATGVAATQKGNPTMPPLSPSDQMKMQDGSPPKDKNDDPFLRSSAEKQAKLRNEERQKRLVSDSDKLLALATQLHDDVSKTNKDILSVEVVRRAEEIEKLARSVKERMKN